MSKPDPQSMNEDYWQVGVVISSDSVTVASAVTVFAGMLCFNQTTRKNFIYSQ